MAAQLEAAEEPEVQTTEEAEEKQSPPLRTGLEIDFKSRPLLVQMYGKQGSGKSELCRALLYAASKQGIYDWVIVFTAVRHTGHTFCHLSRVASCIRVWCSFDCALA